MSTPAIRAMARLPLTLLVLGVLADDAHCPTALDDLAPLADLLHRGPDLHVAAFALTISSVPIYPSRWRMRPRPGSPALSSTLTRSPGRMPTASSRAWPTGWASTRCPSSSSTL